MSHMYTEIEPRPMWRRVAAAIILGTVAISAAVFAYSSALREPTMAELVALKRQSRSAAQTCTELDGMLDCVQNEDVGDEGLSCSTLLDYGLNKFCSGDYTITDDEVAEIEALGDDCIAITDLLEDCWDDTSVDCQVYELEIDELADEYLGCDMR